MSQRDVLDTPYPYKSKSGGNYLIFPNTSFVSLDLTDCNDALHGICLEDVNTIEECIERGRDTRYTSGAGYFVKSKSGKKYCVPIRTAIHPFLNPALRLRQKHIHPELEDMASWAFLNTDMYPYPPNNATTVTYQDRFLVQHVFTGRYFAVPKSKTEGLTTTDSLSSALTLHFLPYRDTMFIDQVFIPVRVEYDTLLNIPNTNLVLKREGERVVWKGELGTAEIMDDAVRLHSVKEIVEGSSARGARRAVRPFRFDESFYLTMGTFTLGVLSDGNVRLLNEVDWRSEELLHECTFRLVPKVEVWRYEDGGARAVSLEEAMIKGWKVYRSPLWVGASEASGVVGRRGVVGLGLILIFLFVSLLLKNRNG